MNTMTVPILVYWIAAIVCGIVGFSLDISEFKMLFFIFLALTGATFIAYYFNREDDSDD